jgi:hypothetical protein
VAESFTRTGAVVCPGEEAEEMSFFEAGGNRGGETSKKIDSSLSQSCDTASLVHQQILEPELPQMTHLPGKSSHQTRPPSTDLSSTTSVAGSKRALTLVGNLKTTTVQQMSKKQMLTSKTGKTITALHRSYSLPNEVTISLPHPSHSLVEEDDEHSVANTVVSESDLDRRRLIPTPAAGSVPFPQPPSSSGTEGARVGAASSSSLSGFKKFQQIVQCAANQQTSRKKFITPSSSSDFPPPSSSSFASSSRRLYNESSNSSLPDNDPCGSQDSFSLPPPPPFLPRQTPLQTDSTPPSYSLHTPTSSSASLLPGGLFSVCTRPAPPAPPSSSSLSSTAMTTAPSLPHASSFISSSLKVDPILELEPSPCGETLGYDTLPSTQPPPSSIPHALPRTSASMTPIQSPSLVSPREEREMRPTTVLDLASPLPVSNLTTRRLTHAHLTDPPLLPSTSSLLDPEAEDYVRPSLCFSLEERLASCSTTLCGSYALAAFTNGTIRLYELLRSGNTDLEDRVGYILGLLTCAATHKSLRVHTQCSGGVLTVPFPSLSPVPSSSSSSSDSPSVTLKPSHIFIGARLGSTELMVIDTLSVTRSRKRRGFLTMTDSQIHITRKSDTRLRGFCSVIPVQIHSVACALNQESEECLLNYDHSRDVGYHCRYHLLCGAAYVRYTVWEVTLRAIPSCSCLTSGGGGGESDGNSSRHEVIFQYTEEWSVVAQGSTNGPSCVNAALFSHYPSNTSGQYPLWLSSSSLLPTTRSSHPDGPSLNPSPTNQDLFVEMVAQGLNKDARITQITSTPSSSSTAPSSSSTLALPEHPHLQVLGSLEDSLDDSLSSFHDVFKPHQHPTPSGVIVSQTVTPLRGISNVFATSSDGMIIFAGLDELAIYR